MHGGWCWERVRPLLDWPSVAVDLPGRPGADARHGPPSLADYVAAIVAGARRAALDEIVLVGHSMAGVTIPAAALDLGAAVRHLVFVSCLIPRAGTVTVNLVPPPLRGYIRRRLVREAAHSDGFALPKWVASWGFFHDLPREDAQRALGRLCPEPTAPILERVSPVVLPATLPRTYVGFRRDRVVPPVVQRRFAASVTARMRSTAGGHDGMLSEPGALAAVLNRIATESFGA